MHGPTQIYKLSCCISPPESESSEQSSEAEAKKSEHEHSDHGEEEPQDVGT